MLWVALHFPALSLEIFSRGAAITGPLAVIERHGNRSWVKTCNDVAKASGVRSGMSVSAAQALAAGLAIHGRNLAAEQESLCGIAAWAGRFTPAVSLQAPDGLLLEIGSCLRLHHGLDNLLGQVHGGLNKMGYTFSLACAPAPHGAWIMAQAGAGTVISEPAQLEKVLGALSVRMLDQPPEILESLEMVGADTLGDCLRLPRDGVARRFGHGLLDELDRSLGRLPEVREFFVPPSGFERSLELPAQVHEAQMLLFAACRLLPELEGYLILRQAGVQEFELICCHEDIPHTVLKLGFVRPTRAVDRMQLLLRETLANTCLPAPVHAIGLNARIILPLAASSVDMFQDNAEARDDSLLLERLLIRLGKDAVFGISPVADYRPERAWRPCQAGDDSGSTGSLQRPVWLLPKPLPCQRERLVLKAGPERIESGWWDGMDVIRDYYLAQDRNGSRLWVYCERSSGDWFVHGLFS
jgi:protein ImuB